MAIRRGISQEISQEISLHRKGLTMMSPFLDAGDLEAWLTQLGSHYVPYTEPLWEAGVRTIQELSNASASTLRQAGVQLDLHLDNIKATAAQQGVCWEMRKGKIPGLSPSSHMLTLAGHGCK